jgi:hypothetical protein
MVRRETPTISAVRRVQAKCLRLSNLSRLRYRLRRAVSEGLGESRGGLEAINTSFALERGLPRSIGNNGFSRFTRVQE